LVFNFGNYPILAISAISFCGLLPASLSQTPTPIDVLLKTKAKPQFERPVERLSTPLFRAFLASNHVVSALSL